MARFCENPECFLFDEKFADRLTPQPSIEVEVDGQMKTFGRKTLDPTFGTGKLSQHLFLCSSCYNAAQILYDKMRQVQLPK